MTIAHESQRIERLTPLADVLACIDGLVTPVAPRQVEIAAAIGRVLAEDALASVSLPAVAHALRDGFAVDSSRLSDASPYAPVVWPSPPVRVDAGDALPAQTDAVIPLDAVNERSGRFNIVAGATAGEGTLAAGTDMRAGAVMRRKGERLRHVDAAALSACRLAPLSMRVPQVQVINARGDQDSIVQAACSLICRALAAEGAEIQTEAEDFSAALEEEDCDAIIVVGGTGSGRNDASVRQLAEAGRVEAHGVALLPGETAAFGMVENRSVLLVPGRLDAALAVWVTLGSRLLARLSGSTEQPAQTNAVLARKIASPLGFSEILPMRWRENKVEAIASGYWPLIAIAQSNGWILIPDDSEGSPAGTEVVLRPWP